MKKQPTKFLRWFPYFGAKASRSAKYPAPAYDSIVEPFAGSAAYANRYHEKDVTLNEKNAVLAGVWEWLIQVPEEEFLRLPTFEGVGKVSELGVEGAANDYLRLWAAEAPNAEGRDTISPIMRNRLKTDLNSTWTEIAKESRAKQLAGIRHWKVTRGDYHEVPKVEATYFVDPPYQQAGKFYTHSSNTLDYKALANWCLALQGQVIVCEAEGATWLPFQPLGNGSKRIQADKSLGKGSGEAVWINTF